MADDSESQDTPMLVNARSYCDKCCRNTACCNAILRVLFIEKHVIKPYHLCARVLRPPRGGGGACDQWRTWCRVVVEVDAMGRGSGDDSSEWRWQLLRQWRGVIW